MTKEEAINILIKDGVDANKISDGYHTFGELYEHRFALYIALCRLAVGGQDVWRSKTHSDGSSIWPGWFVLGISTVKGQQITYHLPMEKWEQTRFAITLDKAPEFDGHTSNDVLSRVGSL